MRIIARLATATLIAAAPLVFMTQPASAVFPAPDGATVVQRIETPVDDTATEGVQMIVALAIGAGAATAMSRIRGRSRTGQPAADG
jgi:hypothetical protein